MTAYTIIGWPGPSRGRVADICGDWPDGGAGTGWVSASLADSIEYLFNGDTAIAGMQYSILPSWAAFVADRDTPRWAG